MAGARMTIKDVAEDMKRRGCGMTNSTIAKNIECGAFTFGKVIGIGETGRRTFLILRRDYESWADKYLGG